MTLFKTRSNELSKRICIEVLELKEEIYLEYKN